MNLAPIVLEHGERFGSLTVIETVISKQRGKKYRCGCICGNAFFYAKARQLMRGEVKECARCSKGKAAA